MGSVSPLQSQLLVMMLGVPGSGKSTFARQLAEALDFKRASSDAIRTELFGRPDPTPKEWCSKKTFEVLEQRVENALAEGHSVIRDHMHHGRHWRDKGRRQAAAVGAYPIMVWIKTPYEIAHERGMKRELQPDTKVAACPKKMQQSIDRHHYKIDLPADDEVCLSIDGHLNFNEQLQRFVAFCQQYEQVPLSQDREANTTPVEDIFERQIVIMMLGVPGSGKTTFARQLADKLNWQRLNRVALRRELFGSRATLKLAEDEDRLEQARNQQLLATIRPGRSIICDYQHSTKAKRHATCQLAKEIGALPILVYVKTPPNLAIQRGTTRVGWDSIRRDELYMRRLVADALTRFEAPDESEVVLEIDGRWEFAKQFAAFTNFYQRVNLSSAGL